MVDIHCHILHGVDDGSVDWKTTLEMCRMAAADGVRHIVATPHANDEFAYDRKSHARLLDELRHRVDGPLTFSLGCAFHLSHENFQAVLSDPNRYCIEETRYLLVEFSDFVVPPNTSELLKELAKKSITPIITHPERNPILQGELERVLEWVENGAVVQVTADAITGRWGARAQRTARFLLDHAAVHVVASPLSQHFRAGLSWGRAYGAQIHGCSTTTHSPYVSSHAHSKNRAYRLGRPLCGLTSQACRPWRDFQR